MANLCQLLASFTRSATLDRLTGFARVCCELETSHSDVDKLGFDFELSASVSPKLQFNIRLSGWEQVLALKLTLSLFRH